MTSLLFHSFGLTNRNSELVLQQYRLHSSYAGNLFDFTKYISKFFSKDSIYLSLLNEYLSTIMQTTVFGLLLYFTLSISSYLYVYKWKKEKLIPQLNGKYLIWHDIKWSCINIAIETFLVSLLRIAIPRFSFIYYDINDYSYIYFVVSILLHIIFDEFFTYWVHRILHTSVYLYRKLHYVHHRSNDVTPFAGFAFHPIDAFFQAVPTFVSSFFFPIHYNVVLAFGIITTIWAISIHDNVPALPIKLFLYATHHTIHHEKGYGQLRNYGKFTTVCDRLFGSYDDPDRIYFGYEKNEEDKLFYKKINEWIDRYIPDRTSEKDKMLTRNKKKK